jgi:integrase
MAGQIIKKGDRKYLVRVSLGKDANGKRKLHSKTIHGTKKEAEAYRNKILHQISTGTYTEPSKDYFSEYILHWRDHILSKELAVKHLGVTNNL